VNPFERRLVRANEPREDGEAAIGTGILDPAKMIGDECVEVIGGDLGFDCFCSFFRLMEADEGSKAHRKEWDVKRLPQQFWISVKEKKQK
jgi:hypothetical protein